RPATRPACRTSPIRGRRKSLHDTRISHATRIRRTAIEADSRAARRRAEVGARLAERRQRGDKGTFLLLLGSRGIWAVLLQGDRTAVDFYASCVYPYAICVRPAVRSTPCFLRPGK